MVPPETYVKVAGHLRSFQVKSGKKRQLKCICMKQFLGSCLSLGYLRLSKSIFNGSYIEVFSLFSSSKGIMGFLNIKQTER